MALIVVPNNGQSLGSSKPQVRGNFATIDTAFAVDHVDFNTVGQGKHEKVTFVNNPLPNPPDPQNPFLVGEMGMFNQTTALTGRPDVWLQRGTTNPYPMSGYNNGAIAGNTARCWSYIPSGLKMISGTATTTAGANGQVTIVFASTAQNGLDSFPGFQSFISSILPIRIDNTATSNTVLRISSFSLTQVIIANAIGTGGPCTFFWTAWGL